MPVAPVPPPLETLDNLNAIFSSIAEGIVMQSASGVIIECNASAERVLGLTRDQMMGRTSIDPRWRAVHEDGSDFPGSEHPSMVAIATGEPVRDVIMGVHKPDGRLSWISVNSVPIFENGSVARVVSTFSDVTVRREMAFEAERLRCEVNESQQMLAAIGDVQRRFIAHEELQLVFERILMDLLKLSDSRCGFIAELTPGEHGAASLRLHATTNRIWTEAIQAYGRTGNDGAATNEELSSLLSRTIATGEVVIGTITARPEDRALLPVDATVFSYLGLPLHVGTQLVGMVGLTNRRRDFDHSLIARLSPYLATCSQIVHATRQRAERARVERDLVEERERMSLVLEASGIGHWDWNPATDEAVFDEQWTGIIGYKPTEIEHSGAQWLRLLHPDDVDATVDTVQRNLRGETSEHRAEFRMRHRDGRWVWVLAIGRVIERDASGQATRMVGVHVDISARKAYETALASATTDAQRANRAKSDFLANMSHEIRTPMNGVIGAANLLLFTDLSDEQREYTDTIRRSGEILLSLIDDILDLSKIEAERLDLERIAFDPSVTIAEAVELEATRADSKGLELIVDWRTRPITQMIGDPRRVQQVLLNLVSNAIKFTEHGHVVIAAERTHAGDLRVSVTDTGIGIPPEKQDVVFETFMQADTSTTRRFGGSGLGLAISRRLVEAMGGTIGVTSTPGAGASFWFTLPTGCAHEEDIAGDGLQDARVLIVDECEPGREATSRLLEQNGARTVRVADVDSAKRLLRQTPAAFDLLITNCGHGTDITPLVRLFESSTSLEHVSVIVSVQANKRRDIQRAVAGGRFQVQRKPISRPAQFIELCTQAVADARVRRSRAAERTVRTSSRVGEPAASEAVRPEVTRRLRILLVEDDAVSRLVAQRMFQKHGCEVTLADEGERALALTKEQAFDLVFMDCNMPGMDGFEAAAAIRARGLADAATSPNVPIIALTANVLVSDRDRCFAVGMVDYIPKPLLPDAVARVLTRWSPQDAESEDVHAPGA